ncbi:LCP family protein [Gordonibacter sp. An230]|uniref:LCP family protein n=1 Tax=Gordonibacter sp. An230 TaxID=1965592 RepID=UPI001EF4CCDC|nr:LCP family protein [Gordonibacter sp. An230]
MQERPHNEFGRAGERPAGMKHAADQGRVGAHRAFEPDRPRGAEGSAYMPVGPDLAKSQDIIRIRKKRKKHSGRKALLIVVAVIVCVFGVVGGAAALYFNSINQALSFEDKETIESLKSVLEPVVVDDEKGEQPYYVLVLGSDAREGDTASRSDVIILTRVDPSNGLITMVSIPRDTMVELEGYGRQKINAAYAYGGAAGAVEAVSAFAGVPISHYAEIHFEELEELVDMLGGVWVDVPVTNDETGSSNSGMHIEAGEQLLNGEQALAFARERYGYVRGDFQRADNQRILAEAIVKKVLSSSPIDLPGTIQKLAGCVSTDYDLTAIIDLARQFQSTSTTFYSALAPSSTMTLDGVSYVVVDPTDWAAMMERVDAGEDPTAVEADAPVSDEAPAEGESPGAEAGSA